MFWAPTCLTLHWDPIQTTPDQFSSLHHLSLPLLNVYKTIVYRLRNCMTKSHLTEIVPQPHLHLIQKQQQWMPGTNSTKNTKLRQVIFFFRGMFQPRCIYAVSKLSQEEEIVIKRVKVKLTLVVQLSSLPTHHSMTWYLCDNCCCADPIEAAYYSATLKKLPLVYFYCGIGEEGLVMEGVAEL